MNFFKSSPGKIIFFTKNSPKYYTGEYTLILSPQFYWVKRVELPVKNEYKAKKLAPSIFEGILPKDEKFEYEVKYEKNRGTFIVIAYSPEYIYKAVKEKFLLSAKVKGIYLAQYELAEFTSCIAIDKDVSLGNVDGLLIQVPASCFQSEENIKKYLSQVKLESKKIKIKNLDNEEENTSYILYMIVLLIFLSSQINYYFAYFSGFTKYNEKKEYLLKKYNLPKTTFQLNSIKKSLLNEYKIQKNIRDVLADLDKVSLNKDEKYYFIDIKKSHATFHIRTTKANSQTVVKKLAKYFKISNLVFSDNILSVEVEL